MKNKAEKSKTFLAIANLIYRSLYCHGDVCCLVVPCWIISVSIAIIQWVRVLHSFFIVPELGQCTNEDISSSQLALCIHIST